MSEDDKPLVLDFTSEAALESMWTQADSADAEYEVGTKPDTMCIATAEQFRALVSCIRNLRALTVQPAAGAQQASAWTTVTDDPATWPRDCGPVICVESDNNWCHTRVTSNARRLCEGGGLRGWKWHQWPSLLAPPGESREQGECRKHSHDRYSPLSPPAGMRELLAECKRRMRYPECGLHDKDLCQVRIFRDADGHEQSSYLCGCGLDDFRVRLDDLLARLRAESGNTNQGGST